jgi:hypothetical protein
LLLRVAVTPLSSTRLAQTDTRLRLVVRVVVGLGSQTPVVLAVELVLLDKGAMAATGTQLLLVLETVAAVGVVLGPLAATAHLPLVALVVLGFLRQYLDLLFSTPVAAVALVTLVLLAPVVLAVVELVGPRMVLLALQIRAVVVVVLSQITPPALAAAALSSFAPSQQTVPFPLA